MEAGEVAIVKAGPMYLRGEREHKRVRWCPGVLSVCKNLGAFPPVSDIETGQGNTLGLITNRWIADLLSEVDGQELQ